MTDPVDLSRRIVDHLGQLPYRHVKVKTTALRRPIGGSIPHHLLGPSPCDGPSHGAVETGIFWRPLPVVTVGGGTTHKLVDGLKSPYLLGFLLHPHPADGARDHQLLDLRSAFKNRVNLCVTVPALDWVFACVAIATKNLNCIFGDAYCSF